MQLTFRHKGLPLAISVADNEQGPASSLENLARLLEGPGG
jgi:hypothetical protein